MGRMSFTQELKAVARPIVQSPAQLSDGSRRCLECYAIVSIATSKRSVP